MKAVKHHFVVERCTTKIGGADSTFKTKLAPTLSQGDGQALVAVPEGDSLQLQFFFLNS